MKFGMIFTNQNKSYYNFDECVLFCPSLSLRSRFNLTRINPLETNCSFYGNVSLNFRKFNFSIDCCHFLKQLPSRS